MEREGEGEQPSVVKRGYLVKRGQARKNWHRRWFLLRADGSLSYFTDEHKPLYLGGVEVVRSTVQYCPDKGGHSFCFVVSNDRRQLYLSATDEKERREWVSGMSVFAISQLERDSMDGDDISPPTKFEGAKPKSRFVEKFSPHRAPKRQKEESKERGDWVSYVERKDERETSTDRSSPRRKRTLLLLQSGDGKDIGLAYRGTRPPEERPKVGTSEKQQKNDTPERSDEFGERMDALTYLLSSKKVDSRSSLPLETTTQETALLSGGRGSKEETKSIAESPISTSCFPCGSKSPPSSGMIQYHSKKFTSPRISGPNRSPTPDHPNHPQTNRSRSILLQGLAARSKLCRSTSFGSMKDRCSKGDGQANGGRVSLLRRSSSTPKIQRASVVDRATAVPSHSSEEKIVAGAFWKDLEGGGKSGPKREKELKKIGMSPKKQKPTERELPESSSLDSCSSEGGLRTPLSGTYSPSPSSPFDSHESPQHPDSPMVAASFQGEVFESYVRSNPKEIRKSGYAVFAPVWESDSVPFSMTQEDLRKGNSAPQTMQNFSSGRRGYLARRNDEKAVCEGFLGEVRDGGKPIRKWCLLMPSGRFLCFRNQTGWRTNAVPDRCLDISKTPCVVEKRKDDTDSSFTLSYQGSVHVFQALSVMDRAEWLAGFDKVDKTYSAYVSAPALTMVSSSSSSTPKALSPGTETTKKATTYPGLFMALEGAEEQGKGGSEFAGEEEILSVCVSSSSSNDSVEKRLFDRLKSSSGLSIDEFKDQFEDEELKFLDSPIDGGQTFLHVSLDQDALDIVEWLISRGVNLRATDEEGSTPLHFCKSVAALKLLLEADPKVDINVIDENSTTAFTQLLAIRDMDETTFNVLVEEYGADVHRRNIRLESPLHFAARFGSERVVELLLEKRANPNTQNDKGMTPLHYAVIAHREIIASCLLANGADPFLQAHDGQSARECSVLSEIWDSQEAKTGFSLLIGKPLQTLFKLLKNENEEYLKVFFLTYHTFTTDEEILDFIKGELNVERPAGMEDQEFFAGLLNPVRVSVVRLVLWWVRVRYFDLRFPFTPPVIQELLSIVEDLCHSISEQAGGPTIEQIATLAGTSMDDTSPIPTDHPLRLDLRELHEKANFARSPRRGGKAEQDKLLFRQKPKSFSNWMRGIRGVKKAGEVDEPSSFTTFPKSAPEETEKDDEDVPSPGRSSVPSPPPSPHFDDQPPEQRPLSEEFNVIVQDASLIIISQLVRTLKDMLQKWYFQAPSQTIEMYETFVRDSPHSVRPVDLRVMKAHKIARFLTLLHFELLYAINPAEMLDPKWTETPDQFPNLRRYVDHFNTLSRWVAWTIMDPVLSKDRALVLTKWVHVADDCRLKKNFCALVSILGGLLSTPIHRMKRTFAGVSKTTLSTLNELKNVMDPRGSSSAYRKLISAAEAPCVPYLGIIMQDVTFISDGNPDYVGNKQDKQVNFSKRKQIFNAIAPVLTFQHKGYKLFPSDPCFGCLSEVETLRRGQIPPESLYFLTLERYTEKELDALSLEREPRE